jgi:IS30 family transposase
MRRITRLSFEEREFIEKMIKNGISDSQISLEMKRCPSTIHREIRRNGGAANYTAEKAQKLVGISRNTGINSPNLENNELKPLTGRVIVINPNALKELLDEVTEHFARINIHVGYIYDYIKKWGAKNASNDHRL